MARTQTYIKPLNFIASTVACGVGEAVLMMRVGCKNFFAACKTLAEWTSVK